MKWPVLFVLLGLCFQAEASSEFKNLKVLPSDIGREELKNIMNGWSVALGFRCDSCHWTPTGEFDDLEFELDKKETKKTARKMFQMMTRLNESFFAERETQISCYTCHHGTGDPRPIDEILAASFDEGGVAQVSRTYNDLREQYHGLGAYNFGPWTGLTTVAYRLAEKKQYEEAKALHELNLEHNPDYDGSHFALGVHYISVAPDEEKARHHMKRAMEGNAFWTPRRLLRLAASLESEERPAVAVTTLRLLTEIAPDVAEGHFQLGRALAATGSQDEARAAYRMALHKEPGHEAAKAALEEEE